MVDGITSRPFSANTLFPFKTPVEAETEEAIVVNSRKRYTRPRWAVEEEINRWTGMMGEVSEQLESGAGIDGVRYETRCSACGKTAKVPFEPQPGRPVYCKDCLEKIKRGEMQSLRGEQAHEPQVSQKYFSDLASLGIEFGASKSVRTPEGGAHPASPAKQGEYTQNTKKEPSSTAKGQNFRPAPPMREKKSSKPDLYKIISESFLKNIGEENTDKE
jgi:CxxC-x17-CxxC domain-containing protein